MKFFPQGHDIPVSNRSNSTSPTSSVFPPIWSGIFRRFLGLDARVLNGEAVDLAKRLLHDVYYCEQKWVPPAGNPSELRIENGRFQDNLNCTWIGVYDERIEGGKLVAVMRVLNNELEYKRYLPKTVEESSPGDGSCEANRTAIRKTHRGGIVFPFLVLSVCTCAYQRGFRSIKGTAPLRLLTIYQQFGFIPSVRMRYHPSDAQVTLVYSPLTRLRIILLALRMCLWKLRRVIYRILRKTRISILELFAAGKEEQIYEAIRSRL